MSRSYLAYVRDPIILSACGYGFPLLLNGKTIIVRKVSSKVDEVTYRTYW